MWSLLQTKGGRSRRHTPTDTLRQRRAPAVLKASHSTVTHPPARLLHPPGLPWRWTGRVEHRLPRNLPNWTEKAARHSSNGHLPIQSWDGHRGRGQEGPPLSRNSTRHQLQGQLGEIRRAVKQGSAPPASLHFREL